MRRMGALSVAFLMVACAAQDTGAPAARDLSQATRLFSVGFQDITDIYIDDISVSDLALAGLGNLSAIEPDIAVKNDIGRVSVSFGNQPAGIFQAPQKFDAEGWGNLTATALTVVRNHAGNKPEADPEKMYEVVFDGVLGALDNFSRYAGREEARENRASRDGFGGIGVRIRLIDTGVQVLSVMEETPAEIAGLKDNDVITAIDGESTVGLSQRDIVRRLRGPLRSNVDLTVARAGDTKDLDIQVVRAHIVPQTVKYDRLGNVAHIRVSGFNQSTTRSLREKLKLVVAENNPPIVGIVLDLRGNPGGLLDQAVAVADLFLSNGRIVSTHGRHPDSHQYFDAEPEDVSNNLPVAVLVNGNSASASEIVAAALQDLGRAVVVGSTSYGKGTVQTVLRLPNEGELTLTWARFHAPSGYGLSRRGVMPDICTSGDVTKSDEVLNMLRTGALPIDQITQRSDIDPNNAPGAETLRAKCPPRQSESDIDIEVAQRLLDDPALFALARGVTHNTAKSGAGTLSSGLAAAAATPQ
jgi:carboxyl-terminal processing protease